MSTLSAGAPPAPTVQEDRCARCGAALEPDQEWCLECGSARTIVHRPPDPRIGAAIVGAVVLAALIALAIVLLNLSSSANRELATTARPPAAPASVTHAAPASVARAAPAPIADWPVGLSGWTAVLSRSPVQATAFTLARRLAATGLPVGVLNSAQHPRLQRGYYIVFSGRYPTKAAALAAAASLRARGHRALARQVARPGGL
ncbi:MAG TPA: SPOR domain-containing protein [Solirubrobacteraceae bacterium]|nr:SPOR domain-containing protein [Solirubrobacteraceae bacterium]